MVTAATMNESTPYQMDACPGVGWLNAVTLIGCMMIILSPFYAFYINGRVDDSNWMPALGPCLLGAGWIIFEDLRFRRRVPKEIRMQRATGKLFAVLPPASLPPLTFATRKFEGGPVMLDEKGISISAGAHIRSSWALARDNKVPDLLAELQGKTLDFMMQIAWDELQEWRVKSISDKPDYFELWYRNGQFTELHRPLGNHQETAILDYVRSVGQCPVRLYDNAR